MNRFPEESYFTKERKVEGAASFISSVDKMSSNRMTWGIWDVLWFGRLHRLVSDSLLRVIRRVSNGSGNHSSPTKGWTGSAELLILCGCLWGEKWFGAILNLHQRDFLKGEESLTRRVQNSVDPHIEDNMRMMGGTPGTRAIVYLGE